MGREQNTVARDGQNSRLQSLIDKLAVERTRERIWTEDSTRRKGQFYPDRMGGLSGDELVTLTNLVADSMDLKPRLVCSLVNKHLGCIPVTYNMICKLRYRLKT